MTYLNSVHDFTHLAVITIFTFVSPCEGEIRCHVSFENLLHSVGNFTNTATESCRLKQIRKILELFGLDKQFVSK